MYVHTYICSYVYKAYISITLFSLMTEDPAVHAERMILKVIVTVFALSAVSPGVAGNCSVVVNGVSGMPQVQRPPGGAVYTRWGRTTCPAGATLVYAGYAASTGSLINGGTSDTLCMPQTPQYLSTDTTATFTDQLNSVEYETLGLRQRLSIMSKNTTCHAPSATQTPKQLS